MMYLIKRYLVVLFAFSMLACTKGVESHQHSGNALGTTYQIMYYSDQDLKLDLALDSIFERVNQSMSTYLPKSDISRLNDGQEVMVDSLFREVFRLSRKVHGESGGYFDPTVGNLVNFYGFGPESGLMVKDSVELDSLRALVGLGMVQVKEDGTVIKTDPRVYLDFNAIAKGYTVDLIGHYLNTKDIENYLIELGGELLARGKNLEKGDVWTVGIDDPRQEEGTRTLTAAVHLSDRAMATSGNYRKNRIDPETGKKYVHTINPISGYAEKSDVLSASVLAPNCALADAYATAFMAMGLERTKKVLDSLPEVDVFLIYGKENGEIGELISPGFSKVLIEL